MSKAAAHPFCWQATDPSTSPPSMLFAPIRPTPFAPMSRHSAQLTLTMPANKTRAVLPRGSWREPEIYAALADFGVRGLAWELLRRKDRESVVYGKSV